MVKRSFLLIAFVVVLLIPAGAAAYDLAEQVKTFTLKNGMTWLVVKRRQAPVVSGCVMVRAGSADEETGKTGLAHMFEHMAFKGSSRIGTRDYEKERAVLDEIEKVGEELTTAQRAPKPDARRIAALGRRMKELSAQADRYQVKNEVWEVLARNGAKDLNAYTSKDVTAYYASVPVNRLELWAQVTSDMIFDSVFREFYTERSVVAEERRTSVENDPDGAMAEMLLASSYSGGPYHWSTIGYEEDVLGLTIGDARAFHEKYYVPANMVGVLVGDISFGKARRIITRTFGREPRRSKATEKEQVDMVRGGISKRFAFNAEPSLTIAYHKPTLPNPLEYTFDVINVLLCEGRTSRLEQRLVYDRRMAKDIYCTDGYPGSRYDNLFLLWIEPIKPFAPRQVLAQVAEEVARLRAEHVGEDELERVRNKVTASLVFSLEDNMQLAQSLARFEAIFGDWRLLADYPKRIAEVTAEDVMRVAQQYLIPKNRVVVERLRGNKR